MEKQPAASSTSQSWKGDGCGGCLGQEIGVLQRGKMPGWVPHERAGTWKAGWCPDHVPPRRWSFPVLSAWDFWSKTILCKTHFCSLCQDSNRTPDSAHCPALHPAWCLCWLGDIPLLGQPCADPFSSTPWDQAGREWGVSLLFMGKQSRWEITHTQNRSFSRYMYIEEVACKTKAMLENKGGLMTLAQAPLLFPTCLFPYS